MSAYSKSVIRGLGRSALKGWITMNFKRTENQIALYSETGVLLAEVTFPYTDETHSTVEVDHTFVDASLRGQGIAGKLMDELADELKKRGLKAVPTCSYAVHWFEKHPECAPLLK